MSDDRDDIDAALRRAMAALDGEAPAGYFEALPARTLARLDDPTIGELPGEPARPLRAVQPPADDGDEEDDDAAAFASQIMAAVELPEPAQQGARPRRDSTSASSATMRAVEEAADGGERDGIGAELASASSVRVRAVPVDADGELGDPGEIRAAGADLGATSASSRRAVLPEPALAAAAAVDVRSPGAASTSEADRGRRRRRVRVAIAGIGAIGLAAVAMMYLAVGDRAPRSASSIVPVIVPVIAPVIVSAGSSEAPRSAPAAASPSAGGGSSVGSLASGSVASGDPVAREDTVASAKPTAAASGPASGSAATAVTAGSDVASGLAPGSASAPGGKLGPLVKRPGGKGTPSRGGKLEVPLAPGAVGKRAVKPAGTGANALLPDESGVSSKKLKSPGPRSDRTSLSADDIERAMTAVAGKARACVAGTGATGSLRLTVAPSGRIARVTVTGPLAGTRAAACLKRAVQAATFPPWSGAAQSFDYSYPLSD